MLILKDFFQLFKPIVVPLVVSRAMILFLALFLEWLLDSGKAIRYAYIGDAPLATLSATFDGNWFGSIAAEGYSVSGNISQAQNYAFFPMYPILMRLVGNLSGLSQLHGGYNVAGVILSHIFLFGALVLLYHLTLRVWDDTVLASRSIWIIVSLPWAYVFSMTYTESLFLMLAVGSILVAYNTREKPSLVSVLIAGVLAALGALTRPQGLVIALTVAWLVAIIPKGLNRHARIGYALLGGAPTAIALGAFALFIGVNTGNLFGIFQAKGAWGQGWWLDLHRIFILPPGNPAWLVDIMQTLALITWIVITIMLMIQLPQLRRMPVSSGRQGVIATRSSGTWAFLLYAGTYFLVTIISNPMNSGWGRYLLVVFPCSWLISSSIETSLSFNRLIIVCLGLEALYFASAILQQVTP